MSVKYENRLTVAIILIMWVSAIVSAFVDNIPLTTMMIRIVTNLADNEELKLPMQPLVWALSFGACLGGKLNLKKKTKTIGLIITIGIFFQEMAHYSAHPLISFALVSPNNTAIDFLLCNSLSK